MKKNGFTLVEMLVSFAIVIAIIGIMLNLLFDLKERGDRSYALTKIEISKSNVTKIIKDDLRNYQLTAITRVNATTVDFTYVTKGVVRLIVYPSTKEITYGTVGSPEYGITMPNDTIFGSSILLTNNYIDSVLVGDNSIFKLVIPITNKYNRNDNNITVYHQFNYASVTLSL